MKLSQSFIDRVSNTFAEQGEQWLARLPELIAETEKRYNLQIGSSFGHQSYNYAAHATPSDGTAIVIKFCVPTDEVNNEINALIHMQGGGIVKLLESDAQSGILLLELLHPGEMLSTVSNDDEAARIAGDIMQKIWKPVPDEHNFPSTIDWFDRLDQPIELPAGFSSKLVDTARSIARDLHKDSDKRVVLHGDLHHFNILSTERQPWLAIDPKGVIGECEYEVGALLRNPIPDIATILNTKKVLARRLDLLAEQLNFDRQKILAWSFCQAVLATVWSIDGQAEDWPMFLRCAEILSGLN